MSHTPHELSEIFPENIDKIHEFKENNKYFAKLANDYHTINREIHRHETDIDPTSDQVLENLKKERLIILDKISGLLQA